MDLYAFGMTPERHLPVPLRRSTAAFSRGDDPPQLARTRKAARKVAPSRAAAAANESPAGSSNDDHGKDNATAAPLVAVNLSPGRKLGAEYRLRAGLDRNATPEEAQEALLKLLPAPVVIQPADLPDGHELHYSAGNLGHAIFAGPLDDAQQQAENAIRMIGCSLLAPPSIEEGKRPIQDLTPEQLAFGREFARAYLGEDPYALGVVLRLHLQIPLALDLEGAASALVAHHQGKPRVLGCLPKEATVLVFVKGEHYIDTGTPRQQIPHAAVRQVAYALYCPSLGVRFSNRDGEPPQRQAWAAAFAEGFFACQITEGGAGNA